MRTFMGSDVLFNYPSGLEIYTYAFVGLFKSGTPVAELVKLPA